MYLESRRRDGGNYDRDSRRDGGYYRDDNRRGNDRDDNRRGDDRRACTYGNPPGNIEIERTPYVEHEYIASLSEAAVEQFRKENRMSISPNGVSIRPITDFRYAGFPDSIMRILKRDGFERPTPIQSQGWSIALSGRNMVGVAQTGSGKTLSFILPALVHASAQRPMGKSDGPIVLVLSPTRELALQTDTVAKKYADGMRYRSTCVYGGASKGMQKRELSYSPQIVIATPGRLIDLYKDGAIRLNRVSFLVLDEADRMLDMGFQPQLEEICELLPENKQVLLWSATWPREVEDIARDYTGDDYVKIVIGSEISTNSRIKQFVNVCDEVEKRDLLEKVYNDLSTKDTNVRMIIFTNTKRTCDEVARELYRMNVSCESLHGDKRQNERDYVINAFRNGRYNVLVATDVAARGLDIKDVNYVVNYDFPNNVEDYIHRIGRTARGNDAVGTAFTFFTSLNSGNAKKFVKILRETKQDIPRELDSMTNNSYGSNKYQTRYGRPSRRRY